jgi:pSer/pThr/pTyr-binding forkhead associated (FHA) protein
MNSSHHTLYANDLAPELIILSLRRPQSSTPVQTWAFSDEPIIKIGRSSDNHVILHSSVVSRHHAEIRRTSTQWEVISFGSNGTYLDGERIERVPVLDGMIISFALSGPQLQIYFGCICSTQVSKGDCAKPQIRILTLN